MYHNIDRALLGITPSNHPEAYKILTHLRNTYYSRLSEHVWTGKDLEERPIETIQMPKVMTPAMEQAFCDLFTFGWADVQMARGVYEALVAASPTAKAPEPEENKPIGFISSDALKYLLLFGEHAVISPMGSKTMRSHHKPVYLRK